MPGNGFTAHMMTVRRKFPAVDDCYTDCLTEALLYNKLLICKYVGKYWKLFSWTADNGQ